mgnify:CR=1 FL=1
MSKIIVEVCQNHKGDRDTLKKMIHAAKENGADIIKGQVMFSEDVMHRPRFDEGEVEDNGVVKTMKRPYQSEVERLAGLDMTEEDYAFFVKKCTKSAQLPCSRSLRENEFHSRHRSRGREKSS